MTTNNAFSDRLAIWLHESSELRVPDHLDEVLVLTVATRQRPWWSSPERWLPMATTTFSGRIANPRPILSLLVVLALLAGLVGAAIYVGANLRQPVIHSGLSGNGRILAVDSNGALISYAADGSDRQQLAAIPGGTSGISISPDGRQLAYRRTDPRPVVEIRRLSDQTVVTIRPIGEDLQDDAPSWSPDGRFITFAALTHGVDRLVVAAVDGSSLKDVTPEILVGNAMWRPTFSPDGSLIAFAAYQGASSEAGVLYVMQPDGTGLRTLQTMPLSVGGAGGPDWAPDPAVQRIAYDTLIGEMLYLRVFDLATGLDHNVGPGFWPSWSPDGSKIATCCVHVSTTSRILDDDPDDRLKFIQGPGYCNEYTGSPGRTVCSRAIWSPDGSKLMATDIVGGGLLVTKADGFGGDVARIPLDIGLDRPTGPYVWQPIWP